MPDDPETQCGARCPDHGERCACIGSPSLAQEAREILSRVNKPGASLGPIGWDGKGGSCGGPHFCVALAKRGGKPHTFPEVTHAR